MASPDDAYRIPTRSSGERLLGCFATVFLFPLMFAALGAVLYVSTNLSTAQRLSEAKDATVAELHRVSSQREALLPEPAIVARTHKGGGA